MCYDPIRMNPPTVVQQSRVTKNGISQKLVCFRAGLRHIKEQSKKRSFFAFFQLFTVLHFSRQRHLNFILRTPQGLKCPKTAKLSLWAVPGQVGRASIQC